MVYVHLANGFEEVEALTVIDLLRRAGVEVKSVSITGEKKVMGTHGIPVEADILYEEADYEACEMIVLPGGLPGADYLGEHEGLVKHIRCFAENDKYLAAICAAPIALEAAGVLSGRQVTCYPGVEGELKSAAQVLAQPTVVDGLLVTGRGPGAALEFGFALGTVLGKAEQVAELRVAMCV